MINHNSLFGSLVKHTAGEKPPHKDPRISLRSDNWWDNIYGGNSKWTGRWKREGGHCAPDRMLRQYWFLRRRLEAQPQQCLRGGRSDRAGQAGWPAAAYEHCIWGKIGSMSSFIAQETCCMHARNRRQRREQSNTDNCEFMNRVLITDQNDVYINWRISYWERNFKSLLSSCLKRPHTHISAWAP